MTVRDKPQLRVDFTTAHRPPPTPAQRLLGIKNRNPDSEPDTADEPYRAPKHTTCRASDMMVTEIDGYTILTICRRCHREERWILSGEVKLCDPRLCPNEGVHVVKEDTL